MVNYTIDDFKRLIGSNKAESQQELLQIVIDSCLSAMRSTGNLTKGDAVLRDGHLMFQMAILRAVSIRNLSIYQKHNNDLDESEMNAVDVTSMMTLLRAITENYCIFYNIYADSKTFEEILLKYKIWERAGLKDKQNFPVNTSEQKTILEKEASQIDQLLSEIKQNSVFILLSEKSKEILLDGLKYKKYQIAIDNNEARFVGWDTLLKRAKANELLDGVILQSTLNSHPSIISIRQFATRYNSTSQLNNDVAVALRLTAYALSFFLADFVLHIAKDVQLFRRLPQMHREVIQIYNQAFRNI